MELRLSGSAPGDYVLYAGFVKGEMSITCFSGKSPPAKVQIPVPREPSMLWAWLYVWDREDSTHQQGIRRVGLASWNHTSKALQDLASTSDKPTGLRVEASDKLLGLIPKSVLQLQDKAQKAAKGMLMRSAMEWAKNHESMAHVFKGFKGARPWGSSVMYFPGVGEQHNWFHLATVQAAVRRASREVFHAVYDAWRAYPVDEHTEAGLIWSLSHVITLSCATLPYMFDPTEKDDPTRPFAFPDTQSHFYDCEDLSALAMYYWGLLVRHSKELGRRYRAVIDQYDLFMATMTLETEPGRLGYHAVPLLIHRSCCEQWGLSPGKEGAHGMPLVVVLEGTELLETMVNPPDEALNHGKPSDMPLCPGMFHQRWPLVVHGDGRIGNYRHVVGLMPLMPVGDTVEFALTDEVGVAVPMASVVKGSSKIRAKPTHKMSKKERNLMVEAATELMPCVSSSGGLVAHEKPPNHAYEDEKSYTYWTRKFDLDHGGQDWLDTLKDVLGVSYMVEEAHSSPLLCMIRIDRASADKLVPMNLALQLQAWGRKRERPVAPKLWV